MGDSLALLGGALGELVPQESRLDIGVDDSFGVAVALFDEFYHLLGAFLEGAVVIVKVGHDRFIIQSLARCKYQLFLVRSVPATGRACSHSLKINKALLILDIYYSNREYAVEQSVSQAAVPPREDHRCWSRCREIR
jgi:hypothetical protein